MSRVRRSDGIKMARNIRDEVVSGVVIYPDATGKQVEGIKRYKMVLLRADLVK